METYLTSRPVSYTHLDVYKRQAYVPTTTISAAPTGGGTSYEAVNLLTPKRINTFIGDGTATQFKVDATCLLYTSVTIWSSVPSMSAKSRASPQMRPVETTT